MRRDLTAWRNRSLSGVSVLVQRTGAEAVLWLICIAAVFSALAAPASAQASLLRPEIRFISQAELMSLFPGTFVAEFQKRHKVLIRATGQGELIARHTLQSDRGTWYVMGESLCIRFESWMRGQTVCSPVVGYGPVFVARDVVFMRYEQAAQAQAGATARAPVRAPARTEPACQTWRDSRGFAAEESC